MVTLEEVDKLKVNELKAACKELGLEQGGNKAELAARLKAALAQQQEQADGASGEADAVPTPADGADAAAEEAKPEENGAAEGAEAAGDATAPKLDEAAETADAPGASGAPAATGGKQRAVISFSESEAAKFEATKVQVVNTAPADKPKQLTEAEKVRLRKERFKDPDVERKKQRAQRFNLIDADLEKDKMLKRAERFGTQHPELDKMKLEQRAARFGIVDEETKKKQRLDKFKPLPSADKANFGLAVKQAEDFEEKRKARAARFAATS